MGASVGGPIEPGAAVTLVWGDDPGSQVEVLVVALTPPRLLEWQWAVAGEPPTALRVELTPVAGGTLLVLDHSRLPSAMVAGLAAGWHAYRDALAAGEATGWDAAWAGLLPAYRARVAEL